ncbi:MAG TPA: alpha/beta hydrolase [Geminicoccaceae bacterium]|nr:alpha/beta hydrolase [Geminicoccaceae bacterium]
MQGGLIFPRNVAGLPSYPLPAHAERLELATPEGPRITGNLVRASGSSRGLLLGFGGNAWNGDDLTVFLSQRLQDVDIAVFHYRGYGPSEGEPSEAALYADALLVHDHLVRELAPERVLAVGFSLGTAVAAHLGAQRPLAGLILVTPFDSVEAIARASYFWVPVGALLKHRFRTDEHLRDRDLPVAVILASDDTVVPLERSRALIDLLRRPVSVETVPGSTHNGIYDLPAIDGALRRALDALLASEPVPANGYIPGG